MIDYRIEQVELTPSIREQVTALVNASFPEAEDIDSDRIVRNTTTTGGQPTFYLAAVIDGEIIGFNAFISHNFMLDGEVVTGYQSCWTATSSAHRGKKIFQNLINAGRETVKANGGAFIFGFPNANSRPLFVNKLGFREEPSFKWQMPLVPFARHAWLKRPCAVVRNGALLQDEDQLIALKRLEHGDGLVDIRSGESRLWGIRRKAKAAGIPVPIFEIGGIDIRSGEELPALIRKLRRRAAGAVTAQFVTVASSGYNDCFRRMKTILPPLIVDDIGIDSRGLKFNLFSGVRDYF